MKGLKLIEKYSSWKSIISTIAIVFLFVNLYGCQQGSAKVELQTSKQTANNVSSKIDDKVTELMKKHNVPGVSIAIIKQGKLDSTKTFGVIQKGKSETINKDTMFSVGSISKVVNAVVTLKLVDDDKLKLDEDINKYLTKWKVEENEFTKDNPVTLRHILSHTAGFTVHGFADYLPEESIPNTLQILQGTSPAKSGRVYVNFPVGSRFRYSGGGSTVGQLIIEETTRLPYHKATNQILFEPLKLKRTSYENPLPKSFKNIAKAHNSSGKPVALPRGYQAMPEAAASGLWTTPSDLAEILISLLNSQNRKKAGFLSSEIVKDMMTAEANSEYGLGPRIRSENGKTIAQHGGANDSYRAHFSLLLDEDAGFVIFTNGTNGNRLINELNPLMFKQVRNK